MRLKTILSALLLLPGLAVGSPSPLAGHLSPYLAMHAEDPVRWQRWGEEVLQQARRENRLVFISSGYFACHWCHVMANESFRNETIAVALNRMAIPVKVDRELNPELDAALFDFVERTRGVAGWPLNVFLTPQGYPLVGMVYLPPDEFLQVVENLEQRWIRESEALEHLARASVSPQSPPLPTAEGMGLSEFRMRAQKSLVSAVELQGDFLDGGLGDGGKFPQAPLLETLLLQAKQDGTLKDFTELTLEEIAGQGLHDHLGGGFFRYTVDPNWQQPHFEKMLYDNALLARLYLLAAKKFARPAWRALALRTINFMLREMWHSEGAFIASLSAMDEGGIEGGYYLWSGERLRGVLGEQRYRLVKFAWTFLTVADWQGAVLPIPSLSAQEVAARLGMPEAEAKRQLREARQALLRERSQRSLPRDEKRLAGWNGLALSALSEVLDAGRAYRPAASVTRDYLHSLWDGERLWRIHSSKGVNSIPATLEDYVYVAQGLLDWAMASGDRQSRELAVKLVESARQRFHGKHGWLRGEDPSVQAFNPASLMIPDGPLPSPSALWLRLNKRLELPAPPAGVPLYDPAALLDAPLLYPSYIADLNDCPDECEDNR